MLKKQQKMIKINQKNTILMSEKTSVAPINKGFSWKYGVKEVNPLKQGLKLNDDGVIRNFILVKEVNPLKQGLKRRLHSLFKFFLD